MIRGMTGQASCRFSTDLFDAEMEIRSVNSRYFEFRIKTPASYAAIEIEARKIVLQKLGRGKIDVALRINEKDADIKNVLINTQLAKKYLEESHQLATLLGISQEISLREILSLPQVLNVGSIEIDPKSTTIILNQLDQLIDKMIPMMLTEGQNTIIDVSHSLDKIAHSVSFIKERYPKVLDRYKENLKIRVLEVTETKPSEDRLAIEIELFASRTAINEELVRLDNHIGVMRAIFNQTRHESSKELDFIAQEMNRETNTIASKSSDFEITEHTIILKSEIEKMREQFRNIV
ncbi:MAG: YicC/YloC family endoribonuclease [Brevinema sp.]